MEGQRVSPRGGRPPVLKGIEGYNFQHVSTSTALPMKDETPLIFRVDAQVGNYIDLSLLRLHIGFRIVNIDGNRVNPVK